MLFRHKHRSTPSRAAANTAISSGSLRNPLSLQQPQRGHSAGWQSPGDGCSCYQHRTCLPPPPAAVWGWHKGQQGGVPLPRAVPCPQQIQQSPGDSTPGTRGALTPSPSCHPLLCADTRAKGSRRLTAEHSSAGKRLVSNKATPNKRNRHKSREKDCAARRAGGLTQCWCFFHTRSYLEVALKAST